MSHSRPFSLNVLACALAVLTITTAGCGGAAAQAGPSAAVVRARGHDPGEVNQAAGFQDEAEDASGDESSDPLVTWVATHAIATLWDGPGEDALAIGRVPVGSYFVVAGDGSPGRLPVTYLGNATIPRVDGWIAVDAVGPIPEPGADWTEPDWPERRLVLGQRGELIRGDPALRMVALTFDAGAGSGAVSELLDVLGDRGVRSTFFVAGAFADRYPDVVARIAADGHELANHSYSHPDFRTLGESQMRVELRRATASLEAAAGRPIAALWRPPFGARDDRVLGVVQEEGFRSVYWTFDSGDWLPHATTERIRAAVLRQAAPGAVVVHHVSPAATAEAMPAIVDELRGRGYLLVTVGEILGPE